MEVVREQIYGKVSSSSITPCKNDELRETYLTFELCNLRPTASTVNLKVHSLIRHDLEVFFHENFPIEWKIEQLFNSPRKPQQTVGVKVEGERMAVLMFSETKGLALGFLFCPDQSRKISNQKKRSNGFLSQPLGKEWWPLLTRWQRVMLCLGV